MPNPEIEPREIEAEIFSTGRWNGELFERADLEEIVANFHNLKSSLKPPLKMGHDENQTLLGQADGDPALGWVDNLRVNDDKLIAKFAGVPEVVYDAIRAGRYRHVSAELYFNVRHEGAEIGKVLKAVALLGADLPAVTNLKELGAYLNHATQNLAGGEIRLFKLAVHDGRIAPQQEIEKPEPGSSAHFHEMEMELTELKAYKAEKERLQAEERATTRENSFRTKREEIANFCEAAARDGKISPHLQRGLLGEIDREAHTFSEQGELTISFGLFREFIGACAPLLPKGEIALAAPEQPLDTEGGDPSLNLARLAAARMAELNLSYGEAADYILRTHPALARNYRDYTLEATKGG